MDNEVPDVELEDMNWVSLKIELSRLQFLNAGRDPGEKDNVRGASFELTARLLADWREADTSRGMMPSAEDAADAATSVPRPLAEAKQRLEWRRAMEEAAARRAECDNIMGWMRALGATTRIQGCSCTDPAPE